MVNSIINISSAKAKYRPVHILLLYQTTDFIPVQIQRTCRQQNKCDYKKLFWEW